MEENSGHTHTGLKDTPRYANNRTQYKWVCSKCETSNNTASRSCSKCRTMRFNAKSWKCGKCEKMMTNGIEVCPDCKVDINGFDMNW